MQFCCCADRPMPVMGRRSSTFGQLWLVGDWPPMRLMLVRKHIFCYSEIRESFGAPNPLASQLPQMRALFPENRLWYTVCY
eukprot:scaffold3150_cov109-Skeletonema_dohrnii-CCMP3373.AAC.2